MTELRKRMIECLQLRGLAERTQEAYTRAVRQLAAHYHKSPDQISEAARKAITPLGAMCMKCASTHTLRYNHAPPWVKFLTIPTIGTHVYTGNTDA
jgi:integrase-like protein